MQLAQLQQHVADYERRNKELNDQLREQYEAFAKARAAPPPLTPSWAAPSPNQPVPDPRVVAYCEWMDPMQPSPAIDIRSTEQAVLDEANKIDERETVIMKKQLKFSEVHPCYRKEDDVWERTLNLRILDEAVRGDVAQPMPAPVVFAEDYDNYKEGKYVKDDCWIA